MSSPSAAGSRASRTSTTPIAVTAACLAAHALASASTSNWLWGLNALRWWPPIGAAILVGLGASGLVPAVADALETRLARLGATWDRAPVRGDAIVIAAVMALVFALRDPLRFPGDFDLRVGALATSIPALTLFPQAYPLDVWLNLELPRAWAAAGVDPVTALQGVGTLLGGLFTAASLAFLRTLGMRAAVRTTAAIVLLAGGYLIHFAGYDKYGPLLVGLALVGYGLARWPQSDRGAWAAAVGSLVCVLSHRVGYAVVPAVLVAALGMGRLPRRRGAALGAGLVSAAGALAMLPRTLDVLMRIDCSVHVPGGEVARSLASGGGSGAWLQLTDAFNVLCFLVPLWPLALLGVWFARRPADPAPRRSDAAPARTLAVAAWVGVAGQLAVVLVIRASRGSGRDWDASSGAALAVGLAAAWALAAIGRRVSMRRALAPAVTVSLALSAVTWGTHASERIGLSRIGGLLIAEPKWSAPALSFAYDHLGIHALRRGRPAEAAIDFDLAAKAEPNPRYFHQLGIARLQAGSLMEADAAFARAASLNPRVADPWAGRAQVAWLRGDGEAAGAFADSALRRNPANAEALAVRRAIASTPQTPSGTPR